jgi:hypothetical protein
MDEIPADERPSEPSKESLLKDIKVLPPRPFLLLSTHTHTLTWIVKGVLQGVCHHPT